MTRILRLSDTRPRTEDAVLFDQIRDALLPPISPPAGHGQHQEAKDGYVHDGVHLDILGERA